MSEALSHRYDFLLLFDVQDGNPNGDPDAGNMPRIDAETQQGLVTDVAIKRKLRNWVLARFNGVSPHMIYVTEGAVLNQKHATAWRAPDGAGKEPPTKDKKADRSDVQKAQDWMCRNYWDVRSFGAVMSTEVPAGQVRGPIQLTFARSVDPVLSAEHSITRMAVTNERDLEKERTMGRKFTLPYGLYVARGFIAPHLAAKTGFTTDDLETLKQALRDMFEIDRSAARGFMATRGIYAFRHDSALGNAPAAALFDLVQINRRDSSAPPRHFTDYAVTIDESALPAGVTLERWC